MVTIQLFITVMLIYTLFGILALWWIEMSNAKNCLNLFREFREMLTKTTEKYKEIILDMADSIDELRAEIEKLKKEKKK